MSKTIGMMVAIIIGLTVISSIGLGKAGFLSDLRQAQSNLDQANQVLKQDRAANMQACANLRDVIVTNNDTIVPDPITHNAHISDYNLHCGNITGNITGGN